MPVAISIPINTPHPRAVSEEMSSHFLWVYSTIIESR